MTDKNLTVKVTSRKLKCKAKSKRTGNQCGRWAVNGATVCPMHGAAKGTPARLKAEEQLKAARDELMELLLGIARDTEQSANDRLKAITWALERAGFKAGVSVEVTTPAWAAAVQEAMAGWDDGEADDEPIQVEATVQPALPAAAHRALDWEADVPAQAAPPTSTVHLGELMPQRRASRPGRVRLG